MATQVTDLSGIQPTSPEMMGLNRQREMAKALMQQGMTPAQGQMVSGHYVANPWGNIANVFSAYQGKKLAEDADTKQTEMAKALRAEGLLDMAKASEVARGREAVPENLGGNVTLRDDEGNVLPGATAGQGAVAANPTLAAQMLLGSRSPSNQALGLEYLKGAKLGEGEKLISPIFGNREGDPKLTSEQRDFALAKQQGFQGNFFDYQRQLKQAGATSVSVSTDKSFGRALGDKLGESAAAKFDIAQNAPQRIQSAQQTIDLLDKGAITGAGATFQLNLARAMNLTGKNNAELIKNTELLVSNRGQAVLNNIKTSGLGAGQGFTDKDRMFLENVVGGRIELNAGTLRELAVLEKRAAEKSIDRWNEQYDRFPEDIRKSGLSWRIDNPSAAAPAAPAAPPAPPAPAPAAPRAAPAGSSPIVQPPPGKAPPISQSTLNKYGLGAP